MDVSCKNDVFKNKGIRRTNQRACVFNLLSNFKMPVTAEDIYLKARKEDEKIDLSTVYRILDTFVQKEIAAKTFIINEKKAVYEIYKIGHKHHLVCLACRKIINIEGCPLLNYDKEVEEKTNYHVIRHKLEIMGYCPSCKEGKSISDTALSDSNKTDNNAP